MLLALNLIAFSLVMFAFLGATAFFGVLAICGSRWASVVGFLGMWCLLLLMGFLAANNHAPMRALISAMTEWAR